MEKLTTRVVLRENGSANRSSIAAGPRAGATIRAGSLQFLPPGQTQLAFFLTQYGVDQLHLRNVKFKSGSSYDAIHIGLEDLSSLVLVAQKDRMISFSIGAGSPLIALSDDVRRVEIDVPLADGPMPYPALPTGRIIAASQVRKVQFGQPDPVALGDGMGVQVRYDEGARLQAIELGVDGGHQFHNFKQQVAELRLANGETMELRTRPDALHAIAFLQSTGISILDAHILGVTGPGPSTIELLHLFNL